MRGDQAHEQDSANKISVKNGLNKYSRIGFWLSAISLFISLKGIISFIAIILSFIGLTKTKEEDSKGKAIAFTGIGMGFLSLIYAYYMLITFK